MSHTLKSFNLLVKDCPECGTSMLPAAPAVFPTYSPHDQSSQMADMGVVYVSVLHNTRGDAVCELCAKTGRIKYTCELCKKEKVLTPDAHVFVGSPDSSVLCPECYTVTPAKVWDETVAKLDKRHRYDFDS